MSALGAEGLTLDQRLHFSEHGWLLLESVLDADQCQTYIDALDRDLRYHRDDYELPKNRINWLSNLHLHSNVYLDWLKVPGLVEANRRLMGPGVKMRIDGLTGAVTEPHPDRHERRDAMLDEAGWYWHRDFNEPAVVMRADPDDPRLLYANDIVSITYLTPVSPENGSTAFLDKSHVVAGDYSVVKERCQSLQLEAPAGSIVIFCESLMHSGVPVLSETPRYALLYDFCAHWYAHLPDYKLPASWAQHLRDDELRELFVGPSRT
jgi:hypothetical protein